MRNTITNVRHANANHWHLTSVIDVRLSACCILLGVVLVLLPADGWIFFQVFHRFSILKVKIKNASFDTLLLQIVFSWFRDQPDDHYSINKANTNGLTEMCATQIFNLDAPAIRLWISIQIYCRQSGCVCRALMESFAVVHFLEWSRIVHNNVIV